MIVKIERYYNYPDLKRQSPAGGMKWNEITFTENSVTECDYLVILEYPKENFSIKVNQDNIIHICSEPPNEVSDYRQFANKNVSLIFNQLDIKRNNILSHGALPWHIDKDFDFLSNLKSDNLVKEDKITWITSNQRGSKGHQERMTYLESIKSLPFVSLYGRGIQPISDKWDVLSTSKYAIAYENFQSDYYWTEKISDCFLSYTMPIYFGCNSIEQYFPANSFIQLDPKDKHADLFLKDIVHSKKWEENIEAITIARNSILNEYQLFPFLYNQIKALESINGNSANRPKKEFHFKGKDRYFDNYPTELILKRKLAKIKAKIFLVTRQKSK